LGLLMEGMLDSVSLRVEVFRRDTRAVMPIYKTAGAAAFDLSALDAVTIPAGESARVGTGLVIRVPDGYFLGVFARSGTASRGLALGNGVGVIDADYCGPDDELGVLVRNFRSEPMTIAAGERIAQGIVLPCPRAELVEIPRPAVRNRGGFGSTGQ
jgi:dUTP pyrophosphatase